MCGIAGYLGSQPPSEERVQACLGLMKRRGPDASGVFRETTPTGRQVLLLHSRLAIIDRHDRANQPMQRGDSVIALNGQVFNYRELRKDLAACRGEFKTESDTEVLLEQLIRHGIDGLDECNGMWAFAWYSRNGDLVLCRDRFGEKPLYVQHAAHGIYWGSEIKYFRALSGELSQPDLDHVRLYVAEGYKAVCGRSHTFWKGVGEVPAGSALRISCSGESEYVRYWQPLFDEDDAISLDAAVDGVRERLTQSMELRLRADAPIAFCMSSGVDSNALVALAHGSFGAEVHGFTVKSTDPRYEESAIAKRCADALRIRHTTVKCDGVAFLDGMSTLVRQHDAPVLTISYYLHWLVMRAMSEQGYRVSISGTGADELLTGYLEHHNLWLAKSVHDEEYDERLSAWSTHIKPTIRNDALKEPRDYVGRRDSRSAEAARRHVDAYLIEPCRITSVEGNYSKSPLRNRMLNELFLQVVPPILHEDDLNAMYYSIENRSPFLDRELAEFCFRIPRRHLIRDAYTKYPLRAALTGLVPDFVLWNRRKVGFNGSIRELLDVRSPAVVATIMESPAIFDIVRRDAVEKLLNQELLSDDENKLLFTIVSTQAFLNAAARN